MNKAKFALALSALILVLILILHFYHDERRFMYVVDKDGLVSLSNSNDFGISKQEAEFLAVFRKTLDPFGSVGQAHDEIRQILLKEYSQYWNTLGNWNKYSSDRERFIAFLVLKANGSLPIYSVAPLKNTLYSILYTRDGNCAHQGARLLLYLSLFDIDAKLINWWSPNLPGHVFIDAFDPQEHKSYFLDSTSNLLAVIPESSTERRTYLDRLSLIPIEERRAFVESTLKNFPNFVSNVRNVDQEYVDWTLNFLASAKDSTLTAFSYELPIMQQRWESKQNPVPVNFCEFSERLGGELWQFALPICLKH